jgi:hypothetical protein
MSHRGERETVVHKARDVIMSLSMTMQAVRRSGEPDEELVFRLNDDLDRLQSVFEHLDLLLSEQLDDLYRKSSDQQVSRDFSPR